MRGKSIRQPLQWTPRIGPIAAVVTGFIVLCPAVSALQFTKGGLAGSWDTTLSYGLTSRVESRDERIVCIANGGSALGCNADDGNLNYDRGIVSNVFRITSEVELDYRDYGAFVRGTAFYDFENKEGERAKAPLTDEAQERVGSDAKILDAYVFGNFKLGERFGQVRLGNQVVSWGESTFLPSGINVINPIDVSKLREPGAELRQALEPVPLLWNSFDIGDNQSIELFYQLDWQETIIDPPGTYFSTNDFVGEGGDRIVLGFGAVNATAASEAQVVQRGPNRSADDEGQWGVAFRLFVPPWNGTEFGFYYINYHSRLPIINATTGTAPAAAGVSPDGRSYVETANYFISYPEDLQSIGASFNTQFTRTGFALQGEVSYRPDAPLQIDDLEILYAALGARDKLSPGNTPAAPLARFGQLGLVDFETEIPGFIERDVWQIQATLSKILSNTLGADQLSVIGEAGLIYVDDMPDKDALRLNGPGTFLGGNQPLADFRDANGNPVVHLPTAPGQFESADHFADDTSWGYRVLARLTYNNAVGPVNLFPRIGWAHDVEGVSPQPGGSFLEGRKALTLGLDATYLDQWSGGFSYTTFSGADRYNLINDRDFIAVNVKYSF